MRTKPLRIFHVEAAGPLDLLETRAEGPVLCAIAPLIGHSIHSATARSLMEFETAVRLLGTIDDFEDDHNNRSLVLHISAHGNRNRRALSFGSDRASWKRFAATLRPFIRTKYPGTRIVVISACFANRKAVTDALADEATSAKGDPPLYLFCTEDEVGWDEAAVGWAVFYYLVARADLENRKEVQHIVKQIAAVNIRLHYYRWDGRKYRHFAAPS
jgi:hypothetical protein